MSNPCSEPPRRICAPRARRRRAQRPTPSAEGQARRHRTRQPAPVAEGPRQRPRGPRPRAAARGPATLPRPRGRRPPCAPPGPRPSPAPPPRPPRSSGPERPPRPARGPGARRPPRAAARRDRTSVQSSSSGGAPAVASSGTSSMSSSAGSSAGSSTGAGAGAAAAAAACSAARARPRRPLRAQQLPAPPSCGGARPPFPLGPPLLLLLLVPRLAVPLRLLLLRERAAGAGVLEGEAVAHRRRVRALDTTARRFSFCGARRAVVLAPGSCRLDGLESGLARRERSTRSASSRRRRGGTCAGCASASAGDSARGAPRRRPRARCDRARGAS